MIFSFYTILFLFWETSFRSFPLCTCMRWNVLKISYTMNQQLAKLKSCSVWCFSGETKKSVVTLVGPWGIWPSPGQRPCPRIPLLQEQKWQKSANFGFLYFCPLTPTPIPTKNNLVQPLCDFQSCFKACENIQWCKNTCYLAVKACKIFTWVKYKWLDKNTNWTTEKSRLHHPHPLTLMAYPTPR